jgi:hypothetical protein
MILPSFCSCCWRSACSEISRNSSHAFSGFRRGSFAPASARDVGPKLEECVLEDNDARNKIAVVTVDGIITSHTADPGGQQHGGRDQGAARPREGG